jgi:hypothetical protein
MYFSIDLNELSLRESERVEWKENGDDIDVVKKIVKTISAFAKYLNQLESLYLQIGSRFNPQALCIGVLIEKSFYKGELALNGEIKVLPICSINFS